MRARPRIGAGARSALAFLTVVAVGGASAPGEAALPWFPVVGGLVGLAVGGAWWGAAHVWPRPVAAAIAIVVDLALTGLLHFDGLCDAADGLLAPMPRERRLDVMATPGVGAFGATAVAVAVLFRWAALGAFGPAPLLVAALWAASRAWMAGVMAWVPYARAGGLASWFGDARAHGGAVAVAGVVAGAALATTWRVEAGLAAVAAGTVAASVVVAFAWRRLGGFTGDVLGAAGVVGESVGLLVAAARW